MPRHQGFERRATRGHACFTRLVFGPLKKQSGVLGQNAAHAGAVTFVQRFGGRLNHHVHLNAVVLYGVYFRVAPRCRAHLPRRARTDRRGAVEAVGEAGMSGDALAAEEGPLPAERQSLEAEPDALEQATQTALRLGRLAQVDEHGKVVNPRARRPGRRIFVESSAMAGQPTSS